MSNLARKILSIAKHKPTSPMKISKMLSKVASQSKVFSTIDQMEYDGLVYFDVEDDVLIVLG